MAQHAVFRASTGLSDICNYLRRLLLMPVNCLIEYGRIVHICSFDDANRNADVNIISVIALFKIQRLQNNLRIIMELNIKEIVTHWYDSRLNFGSNQELKFQNLGKP